MATTRAFCLALLLALQTVDGLKASANKRGCGRFHRTHKLHRAASRVPGAGMTPDSITPFDESFMDGFFAITCALDGMLQYGDKHGDGKFAYTEGPVSNTSIVHYTEMVAKGDQEQMTHAVCFDFCRTIPDMSFFGITNGRDCYCTPFFKQVAGDSSDCDAVCDGNPTMMCGGKTKSSIFEMHSCDDAAENLAAAQSAATTAELELEGVAGLVTGASESMQDAAVTAQEAFGQVGDGAASGLAQKAKAFAGTMEHAAEDCMKVVTTLKDLQGESGKGDKEMEALSAKLAKATAEAIVCNKTMEKTLAQGTTPDVDSSSAEQYYSVMYFVDKEYDEVPSTCGGELSEEPLVGDYDGCAAACDADVGECIGFSFVGGGKGDGLCFLFSKLTSATYYTGCKEEGKKEKMFLQRRKEIDDPASVRCVVKFSSFDGTTLKPDGSGKCKKCLKEVTKADRCFA